MSSASLDLAPIRPRFKDFEDYRRFLKVQDKVSHDLVPLEPTLIQRRLRQSFLEQEAERGYVRCIVLKARQGGVSTITQGTFAHRGFTRRNVKSWTVSHESDSAALLHGMTETMYEHLPADLRPKERKRETGRRLRLANGSDWRTETARDAEGGRSGAATNLHLSELAFYPQAATTLRAMLQMVPRQAGTIVVIESTANGVGNEFHQRWNAAEAGRSSYVPVFFAWFEDPTYCLPVDRFSDAELRETLDDEERDLQARYGVSTGQLAWRRAAIEDECGGSLDTFHQEYPSTPTEAFLSSGRQYFTAKLIDRFVPVDPIARGWIDGVWVKDSPITVKRDAFGDLSIYSLPDERRRYLIFVDPAGLVRPAEYDAFESESNAEDFTAMWVVDCTSMQTAAVWHGRIDVGLAGVEAAKLGKMFRGGLKCAPICVEMNGGYGSAVVTSLRSIGYGNIHRDRRRTAFDQARLAQYGWTTTESTRALMLERLRDVLRDDASALKHAALKEEMKTFVVSRRGKPEAAAGCHDDLVMAAAGGFEVALEYAKRERVVVPDALKPRVAKPAYKRSISQRAVEAHRRPPTPGGVR